MVKGMTPAQITAKELTQAEHELLRAETSVEYAQALVTYNKQRVKRLKAYLAITDEIKENTNEKTNEKST